MLIFCHIYFVKKLKMIECENSPTPSHFPSFHSEDNDFLEVGVYSSHVSFRCLLFKHVPINNIWYNFSCFKFYINDVMSYEFF